jgi:hypothetical protein
MFRLTQFTVDIHLKSGQTITVKCDSYRVKKEGGGIVSYTLKRAYPSFSAPAEQITAMVYRRPWWVNLYYWVTN